MLIRRKLSRRRTYTAVLGLFLISLVFIFNDTRLANTPPPFFSSPVLGKEQPDTEIVRFSNTVFDQNGQLKYTLLSPHLFHYTHNDLTLLSAPEITLYEEDKTPWKVLAKKGSINKNDEIILSGKVKITGKNAEGEKPLTVSTNSLTLYTNLKRAESEERVMIYSNKSAISGTGFKADMINNTMHLLSQVEGSHTKP